ncbi:MAG: hypothetical protein ACRC42_04120 [Mycoplasma sp.]
MAMPINLIAKAKVNIGLNVFKLSNNENKHRLESLFVLVDDFSDDITIEQSDALNVVYLLNSEQIQINNEPITKIVSFLWSKKEFNKNFEITINKKIPMSAGLGSSSASAGIIAKYLIDKYSIELTEKDYLEIALSIGSDIPFFMSGYEMAMVSDYGNKIIEVNKPKPNIKIHPNKLSSSTHEAFRLFDESTDNIIHMDYKVLLDKLPSIKNCIIINNLEQYVLEQNKQLKQLKKDEWILTGSGSFFIEL